jgi:hypothetical protein
VGHRLMHLRQPVLHPRASASPAVVGPSRRSSAARARPSDDAARSQSPTATDSGPLRDRGIGLLAVFTTSTLLIVGLVCLVAGVDRWWILIPVMAVDLAVTGAVLAVMIRLLGDGAGG